MTTLASSQPIPIPAQTQTTKSPSTDFFTLTDPSLFSTLLDPIFINDNLYSNGLLTSDNTYNFGENASIYNQDAFPHYTLDGPSLFTVDPNGGSNNLFTNFNTDYTTSYLNANTQLNDNVWNENESENTNHLNEIEEGQILTIPYSTPRNLSPCSSSSTSTNFAFSSPRTPPSRQQTLDPSPILHSAAPLKLGSSPVLPGSLLHGGNSPVSRAKTPPSGLKSLGPIRSSPRSYPLRRQYSTPLPPRPRVHPSEAVITPPANLYNRHRSPSSPPKRIPNPQTLFLIESLRSLDQLQEFVNKWPIPNDALLKFKNGNVNMIGEFRTKIRNRLIEMNHHK